MRILVIDGNNEVLELVRDMLAADHDVYVVRTISEIRVSWKFDLVLADSFNPLCQFDQVRAHCQEKGLPLVAMSASSDRVFKRQLNKPFDIPDLQRVVHLISQGLEEFIVDSVETRYLPLEKKAG